MPPSGHRPSLCRPLTRESRPPPRARLEPAVPRRCRKSGGEPATRQRGSARRAGAPRRLRRLRGARARTSGHRLPDRMRPGGLGRRRRGGRAGGVRQGVAGAAALPCRRAVPAVAAGDRRQRGAQPPPVGRPARRARRARGGERAGLRRRGAGGPGWGGEPVWGGAAPSPEAVLGADGERRELLDALRALDERDRTVIACRYLLDLSERETAQALGCRPGTVKSRLSRALERLRSELERSGTGEVVAR